MLPRASPRRVRRPAPIRCSARLPVGEEPAHGPRGSWARDALEVAGRGVDQVGASAQRVGQGGEQVGLACVGRGLGLGPPHGPGDRSGVAVGVEREAIHEAARVRHWTAPALSEAPFCVN